VLGGISQGLSLNPLVRHELRKVSPLLRQLYEGPLLDDAPICHNVNAVCPLDRAEAMGNDHASTPDLFQTGRHESLRAVVQGTGRFIEEHKRRLTHESAGNEQPLSLPTGEIAAAFTDKGMEAHGHSGNLFSQPGRVCCFPGIFYGEQRTTSDALEDGRRQEGTLL